MGIIQLSINLTCYDSSSKAAVWFSELYNSLYNGRVHSTKTSYVMIGDPLC